MKMKYCLFPLLFITIISCSSTQSIKKIKPLNIGDMSTIDLSYENGTQKWYQFVCVLWKCHCDIMLNDELIISRNISLGDHYKIVLPAGKVDIDYSLSTDRNSVSRVSLKTEKDMESKIILKSFNEYRIGLLFFYISGGLKNHKIIDEIIK